MTIAAEMHAPLLVLTLAHERLAKRGGHEDICTQLRAAIDHLEDLRRTVAELELLQASPRAVKLPPHTLPQRDPSLAELDGAVIVSLHEARQVLRGHIAP